MRKIWCLVGLLGCTEAPSTGPAADATARTPKAATPDAKPATKGGKKGRKGGKATGRSNGNVPHTIKDGLSKTERDMRMIARCSDGNVVFSFWQGEYPSPVVQLDKPLRTKVRKDPCGGTTVTGCTMPKGLYHPWAQDKHMPKGASFAVRTMPERWRTTKTMGLGRTQRKAGTEVEVLSYLAEGFCMMKVDDVLFEDTCPGVAGEGWTRIGPDDAPSQQLIEVPCEGGSTGWLEVTEGLMNQPGVREGEMQGYGEVGPAK